MYDAHMFGAGFWWIFPIVMIGLCFLMMRGMGMCGMGKHGKHNDQGDDPIAILNRRFANGEIDEKDFEERTGALNRQLNNKEITK